MNSKAQILANIIQCYGQTINQMRELYGYSELKDWAVQESLKTQSEQSIIIEKLKSISGIDYNSESAKSKIIKEGSNVTILVNHMHGMNSGTAIVKSYSMPAMLSDITMEDGMKMTNHKWLTNEEVKLK